MSGVQLENGYTRIANKILESLALSNLNGTQRRIIDVIFRQTYGYHRKEHDLSITFIANATGIHKKQVQRELTALIEKNIIIVVREATFSSSRIIQFNKNNNEWLNSIQVTNSIPPNEKDTHTGNELDTSTGSELATQIKKEIKFKENRANLSLYDDLFEILWKLYPNKKGKQDIKESHKKVMYKIGYEKMKQAIENYNTYIEKNKEWYKAMHGGRFFKGDYKDYFEEHQNEEHEAVSLYPDL